MSSLNDNSIEKRQGHLDSKVGENMIRFLPLDEFEVTCIRQEAISPGHYRITQLGVKLGEETLLIDVPVAVFFIQTGKRFFVHRDGVKTFLRTMVSSKGHPYVETKEDSTHLNNLKSLPPCPADIKQESDKEEPDKEPAADPTINPVENSFGRVAQISAAGRFLFFGLMGLLTLFGLAVLYSIVPVFDRAPEGFIYAVFVILLVSLASMFVFRKALREVYEYYFLKRQSGWLGLISLLLLFILSLIFLNPKTPVITFDSLPDKTYLDPDFIIYASASDGGPVNYKPTSNTFCSVTKEGLVHILNAGVCAVTAYNEANPRVSEVTRTFTIHRKSQTLTFGEIPEMVYGDLDFPLRRRSGFRFAGHFHHFWILCRHGECRPYTPCRKMYDHGPTIGE